MIQDIGLDEFLGHFKPPAIAVNPAPLATTQKVCYSSHVASVYFDLMVVQKNKSNVAQGRLDPALQHASHLAKPQLNFKRKVDNSSHTAWFPTLRHKYNAQVPLGYNLTEDETGEASTSYVSFALTARVA